MEHHVKILKKSWLNHNVLQLNLERPDGYIFEAGQAIEATIDRPQFEGKKSPFTFTGLADDAHLQLTMKIYPDHKGMTLAISKLNEGDDLVITDPFDTFKDSGPGIFIAGGTGVTPFIALLRKMHHNGTIGESTLFFFNNREEDIFMYDEFRAMLGDNFVNVLTLEEKKPYLHGLIDKSFLKKHISDFNQPFYICGPPKFSELTEGYLQELGADNELVNVSL